MVRNRELMRVFRDLDLVEQLGSGMNRILRAYDRSVFDVSDSFIVVTFPYAEGFAESDGTPTPQDNVQNGEATPQDKPQDAPQDKPQDMTSAEERILWFCAVPRTRVEIARMLGLKDSKGVAKRYLQPLIAQGRLALTIPDKPTSRNQRYVAVQPDQPDKPDGKES